MWIYSLINVFSGPPPNCFLLLFVGIGSLWLTLSELVSSRLSVELPRMFSKKRESMNLLILISIACSHIGN